MLSLRQVTSEALKGYTEVPRKNWVQEWPGQVRYGSLIRPFSDSKFLICVIDVTRDMRIQLLQMPKILSLWFLLHLQQIFTNDCCVLNNNVAQSRSCFGLLRIN